MENETAVPKRQITVALEERTIEILDGIAKEEQRSMSNLVRKWIFERLMERRSAPPLSEEKR